MTDHVRPVPGLSDAHEIGVMGDVHSDLGHTLHVAGMFARRGITTLLQLGDWGFIWPHENWGVVIDKLDRRLERLGSTMYFIAGNHDAYPLLSRFPIGVDGLQWIRPQIACIPRGWRTVIGGTHSLAALGGANSIDRHYRTPGRNWWAEEQITEDDLTRLGGQKTDVLIGHEAPLGVRSLDSHLLSRPRWSVEEEWYANRSRGMFHRAVLQTRPQLTLGGHYHFHVDESVTYTDEKGAFTCRVVLLDMNGPGVSQAILHTASLELTFLHRNGAPARNSLGPESSV
jgi:hypothetical protein